MGPGFVAGQVEGGDEQLVFTTSRPTSQPKSYEVDLVAAPPGLGVRRVVGRLPGRSIPVGAMVGSRLLKKVCVAGDAGIWAFPIEGGAPTLAAGLPDLPVASQFELQQAYGVNAHNWAPHKKGRPSYHWALVADEAANRLFALCGQEGALGHFVEVDLTSRAIASQVPMPGSCVGIQVDLERRRIILPALQTGPEILDFAGHRRSSPVDAEGRFGHCAVRAVDGVVVLAHEEGGLWAWDSERNKLTLLANDAGAPAWSPNGALFFMRSSAEVWVIDEDAPPRLIVRALGNEGGTAHDRKRSWVVAPRLSRDGRYLLAQLTAILETKEGDVPVHDLVVVDLEARRVQQVPGFLGHTFAWF
jgi:hypothetical protein